MPCPHCKITIIKRSNNESAVSAAAYQSGEKLFSEYDQEQKYYPYKNEVTHKEIMLPPHASPEYADRNTLWNSAKAQEKQWNSQLARRFVLAIPREIPPEQYADLIRDYCREFFVSKGMIADFAIHDKGDGNPHAHILLTMRAMDEKGKWLPKCRKVYDLDGNGERIRLPSGRWKLTFSPEMVRCLKERQWDFRSEDTKVGRILAFLDSFPGDTVCSKQLYKEALNHTFDEPKQWEIREINEIMNQCVTDWKYFSTPHMFAEYGRQKGWEREQKAEADACALATDTSNGSGKTPEGFTPVPEQMELPF